MGNKNLTKRLEELIRENSKITKHLNWGSDGKGVHGSYKMYILMFDNYKASTQWIIVKNYENGRPKGKYSVMTNHTKGDYDSNDIDEIMDTIKKEYELETQGL